MNDRLDDSTDYLGPRESRGALDEIIVDFIHKVEAGEAPDREELLSRHPELRAELEAFLSNRERLESMARSLRGETSVGASLASLSDRGFDHGRFLPGVTLAERYRIVGLLGRGGKEGTKSARTSRFL